MILLCSHGEPFTGQITRNEWFGYKATLFFTVRGILYIRFGNCVRQKRVPASAKLQPVVHRAETRSITW